MLERVEYKRWDMTKTRHGRRRQQRRRASVGPMYWQLRNKLNQ